MAGGRPASPADEQQPPPVAAAETDAAPASDILDALRGYVPPYYPDHPGVVTRALLDRLEHGDHEVILAAADDEWRGYYHAASEAEKPVLPLHYAAYWNVEAVLSRIGLARMVPPEGVHAMARGPLAAGGGLWFADLIVDAAARTGAPIGPGQRVLDFGCSSGRVLAALAAWRQDVDWIGCDPNATAAAWADSNLPHVSAFESPQEPPLHLDDGSLDIVYAVSVWSHFGEQQAIRWLAEMHRVLKPGGVLIITTQGYASIAHYLRGSNVTTDYARSAAGSLVTRGHAYFVAFGEDGDWGVKHPEWGMGFMTADWLATHASLAWSIRLLELGRVDTNQDLVVLVRS